MKPRIDRDLDGADAPEFDEFDTERANDSRRVAAPDLGTLPIAGITRRRVAWVLAGIVTIWVISIFARQVGDAGAAADRANQLRQDNTELTSQVVALQSEVALVQKQAFIEQQARAYGLGGKNERQFALAADAPALPADAPGSAAVRLGATTKTTSPLDTWLELLFGPGS